MPDPVPGRHNPIFTDAGGLTPNWFLQPHVNFNAVSVESLRDPLVRSNIPDLRTALELWRDQDDLSLLVFRGFNALQRAQLPLDFITNTYVWLEVNKRPYMIHSHESSFSTAEKLGILEQDKEAIFSVLKTDKLTQPLKTITLGYEVHDQPRRVLVSGVGDFKVDNRLKRGLRDILGVSRSVMDRSVINPSDFDTTLWLGLIPGIVGPIIQPHLVYNLDGICILQSEGQNDDFVEIAVSPIDSLIVTYADFRESVKAYASGMYDGFALIETEGIDFWLKQSDPPDITIPGEYLRILEE